MPKSFLFTHRRYNLSPIPSSADETLLTSSQSSDDNQDDHPVANKQGSKQRIRTSYSVLPLSPGQGTEAELKSPGRPQSARISPVIGCSTNLQTNGRHAIPEEMYNLFQLAEVSLAASGGNEFRSVLERWRHQHQGLARALQSPAVQILDMSTLPDVLDKPLDLSRDPSSSTTDNDQVRILTPSPSPTPSESHLTTNIGMRNKTESGAGPTGSEDEEDEEEDASDSCWSPDDVTCCKSVPVKGSASSTGSADLHPDGHECPDCGKRYSTSSNLARHRQTHRSPADQKARRCPHCDKVYVSVPAFSMHVRTHSQGCKCPYCGKSFSRPWLLQGHIRTHTGEKPFTCQICEKAFADKSNLRAHIQTHSNLKPFTCQRCGKAFALKSYLYKHEESSCMKMVSKSSTKDD